MNVDVCAGVDECVGGAGGGKGIPPIDVSAYHFPAAEPITFHRDKISFVLYVENKKKKGSVPGYNQARV